MSTQADSSVSAMNRDAALQCLGRARAALSSGDRAKALRFATKSHRLYPTARAEELLRELGKGSASRAGNASPQSSPAPSGPSPPSTPRRAASSPAAAWTPEQAAVAQKVLQAKDLYSVLGVQSGATDAVVKKSYRKLALKLHPDKNHAPRAEEAFKRISHAFQILSDPQKRAHYDRYGDEDEAPSLAREPQFRRRRPRGGGPQEVYMDEISPEELFHMFFSGGGPGMHFARQRRRRRAANRGRGDGGEEVNGGLSILQFIPILLVLLMSFMSIPSSEPAQFGLQPSAQLPHRFTTRPRNVPFFMGDDALRRARRSNGYLREVEHEVERLYAVQLDRRCQLERKDQWRRQAGAQARGDQEALRRANGMQLHSCEQYQQFLKGGTGGGAQGRQ